MTSQASPQASWEPGSIPVSGKIKMAPAGAALNTVELSAVSATLATAAPGGSPDYSSASSPFARGSSSRSSPYNISRTGSGASVGSHGAPAMHSPATHPTELTAAALQALSRHSSLAAAAAAAAGSSAGGSRSESPHGAGTPRPSAGRSNLGPSTEPPSSLEPSLQGLTISGTSSPAATPLNFHALPSSALPAQPPVEVFAKFPQEHGTSARTASSGGRNGGARNGRGQPGGGAPYTAPYTPTGPVPVAGPGAGAYAGPGVPPGHPAAFFVGSPPGGYGMPMFPAPHHAPGVPATAGFPAPAYYPQPMSGPQQQVPHGFMMHPYFGMVPGPFPPPAAPYGVYGPPQPGMAGGRGGGKAAAYEAAEYAHQYQAMMSYMQGFGMLVSPSGSPERMGRPGSLQGFRRPGPNEGLDGRGRMMGRPSRLSLDMSASKSENGDAHKLDPELAPLVAEDKSELQSELLDDFKAGRDAGSGRLWTLQELRGHLYPFCRDQHGSRLVQQQLETAEPQELSELFGEVRHKLVPLMVDVFGNYVVQRFLERGGPEVQAAMAEAIRGKALPLSLQMYGCRVVQKALEVLPQEDRVSICQELTEHTLRCVRDQNGNHVVQKCIECVQPSDPARAMIETIVNKGQSLSTHTFGCRLVQRVLEFCSISELREKVIADVLDSALQLSHDQYGNYVVQHLVIKGPAAAREAIVSKVSPQVVTLAQHKYASNVVEACLKHGGQAHRDAIIEQLVRESGARPAALTALMRDQYGNYVVQRSLEVAMPAQRADLLAAIKPHLDSLRKYTYGKHIVSKVESLLAQQAAKPPTEALKASKPPEAAAPHGYPADDGPVKPGLKKAAEVVVALPVPLPAPVAVLDGE